MAGLEAIYWANQLMVCISPHLKWKWLDTKTLYVKVFSPLGEDVNQFQVIFNNINTLDFDSPGQRINLSFTE